MSLLAGSPCVRQGVWGGAALVVGALLALALMPRDPAASDEDAGVLALAARADAAGPPTWSVGDAWRVQFDAGDAICWLVVVEATDEGYRQGVWCPNDEARYIAAQAAALGIPWLGAFDLDLGGVGDSETTRFFDWPLEHRKAWQTTWYGTKVLVRVSFEEGAERPTLTMSLDGDEIVVYDYDASLGWWSELRIRDGYTFRVHEREGGWTQGAEVATAQTRYANVAPAAVLGDPVVAPVAVPAEDELLALVLSYDMLAVGRFELRDPSGNAMYQRNVAGATSVFTLLPSVPGTWFVVDGVTGFGAHRVLLRGVQFETY